MKNIKGTDFQKMVWSEITKIPKGKTITYKELAAKIGKPKAYRAVANACGRNPIPIIRKRYINSSGSLIAALNLTIERAPTNPKDKANEYFTIIITRHVVRHKMTKLFAKYSLLFKLLEYFK